RLESSSGRIAPPLRRWRETPSPERTKTPYPRRRPLRALGTASRDTWCTCPPGSATGAPPLGHPALTFKDTPQTWCTDAPGHLVWILKVVTNACPNIMFLSHRDAWAPGAS